MLFDSHCHLDTHPFDADREAVYERAHAAGVTHFLNPAYDLESSKRATALAEARPDTYAAVGLHPNDIGQLSAECLSEIEQLAQSKRVVAIGEIGLDYHWDTHPRSTQRDGFVQQFRLAQKLELPVIIHCRDAYDDLMEVLEEVDPTPTGATSKFNRVAVLLRSFAGKPAHARTALTKGYFLGIGGPLTYKNSHTLREIVKTAPLSQLVLETDAPYLTPMPHRGQRNEPAYVRLVAEYLAQLREMSLEQLSDITFTNTQRLFRIVL